MEHLAGDEGQVYLYRKAKRILSSDFLNNDMGIQSEKEKSGPMREWQPKWCTPGSTKLSLSIEVEVACYWKNPAYSSESVLIT